MLSSRMGSAVLACIAVMTFGVMAPPGLMSRADANPITGSSQNWRWVRVETRNSPANTPATASTSTSGNASSSYNSWSGRYSNSGSAPVATPAPAPAPAPTATNTGSSWVAVNNMSSISPVLPSADQNTAVRWGALLGGGTLPASMMTTSDWVGWKTTPPAGQSVSPPSAPASPAYDAFIDFGSGPFLGASELTMGNARSWVESPVLDRFFQGGPNAQQQADFINTVVSRVEETYAKSGVALNLTTNPADNVTRTMSVVSNTAFSPDSPAVGISAVGYQGFSFLDKFSYANNLDDLEWALAHNLSHELMHVFGFDHFHETGDFVDAAVANWSVMIDPNAKFSPEAEAALKTADFRNTNTAGASAEAAGGEIIADGSAGHNGTSCPYCASTRAMAQQLGDAKIMAVPVPEPSALLAWSFVIGTGAIASYRRGRGRKAA